MLTVIVVLKAVAEIALFALIGQGLLRLLSGEGIRGNVFYGVLATLTAPARRVAAWITPGSLERYHGFVAFCMLAVVWLALTIGKIKLVLQHGGG